MAGYLGKAEQTQWLAGNFRRLIDGLGIFRLEADRDADDASAARFSAELYCEKMAFVPGKVGR